MHSITYFNSRIHLQLDNVTLQSRVMVRRHIAGNHTSMGRPAPPRGAECVNGWLAELENYGRNPHPESIACEYFRMNLPSIEPSNTHTFESRISELNLFRFSRWSSCESSCQSNPLGIGLCFQFEFGRTMGTHIQANPSIHDSEKLKWRL